MHDPQYRLGIAWQNVAYNQPPHVSLLPRRRDGGAATRRAYSLPESGSAAIGFFTTERGKVQILDCALDDGGVIPSERS